MVSESQLDKRHSELIIAGLGSLVDRHGNFIGGLSLSSLRNVRLSSDSGRSNADCRSMYFHTTELKSMTAAWLLPIVAPIVAAATGAIVANVLPNPQHALITVIVSYILWGTGVPLAMTVLVLYFQRLTIHNLPPR